jgi:hypothetical protein
VLIAGRRTSEVTVLVDTNVIIESVRTGCWNALTGGLPVETVEECREETRRGAGRKGYVEVSDSHLHRLRSVHAVDDLQRAELLLAAPTAAALDPGERDLLAHSLRRANEGDAVWVLCSPDRAAVRTMVDLRRHDHLRSLQELLSTVGVSAKLAVQFGTAWLAECRTACLLGQ